MARGVRTIAIRFLGDTKDLQKAGKDGEKAISRWQASFRKLDKIATGVLVGLGGAIAGAVTQMAATGDEIATTAQRVGVGVEALQELRYWGDEAGISQSDLERAIGRLNQRLGDGEAEGNKYVTALQAIGVATQDANGQVRDTESVMRDTIAALRDIENPSERAAAAGAIFGTRLGRQLMPALSDTSLSIEEAAEKAREMGIIMDEDTVNASAEFASAMSDLKTVGAGLITNFATPFLEILSRDVLPVIQDHVVPALRSMARFMSENRGVVLAVVAVLGTLAAVIKVVTTVTKIWGIVTAMTPLGAIITLVTLLVAAIVYLATQTTFFQDLWETVWGAIKGAAEAVGRWFSETLWGKWIKGSFDSIRNGISAVADWISNKWDAVMAFFRGVPGKLKSFFSKVRDFITAPFRAAFNFVADAWNNTVGQLRWSVPDWVPGIGGRTVGAPQLPKFHNGGVMPGGPHDEGLALLRGGEVILTPEQAAAIGGGDVYVIIDGRALDESMVRVVRKRDRDLRRRVLAGTGAAL